MQCLSDLAARHLTTSDLNRIESSRHVSTSCSSSSSSPQLSRHRHRNSRSQEQCASVEPQRAAARHVSRHARPQLQVLQAAVAEPITEPVTSNFQELVQAAGRRYVMISGKGGVGKTSLAASLAVRLAAEGHNTLVVSTDPAHSLSDSLGQDVSGGSPVMVAGTDVPLWGMEIDPDESTKRFRASSAADKGQGVKNFLGGMGLGMIANQLADLKLGELLDTPPPGLDEAVAIAKVVEFVNSQEYAKFSRIIFDTAPTGHTLRLLTVPDFVEAALNKLIKLRLRLGAAGAALRGLFGAGEKQDAAVQQLENLRDSVVMVRDLFRDRSQTEFIIATIPTVLGVNESDRLATALAKEHIPCRRIIVNQVIDEGMGSTFIKMKLKDQERSMQLLAHDPQLSKLTRLEGPMVDMEVRGVPALQYFGNLVWGPAMDEISSGKQRKHIMLGGKGGVGKTSSAASLGVKLAQEGHSTLVVSTDPAHSLSDALDQDVSGGQPVRVEAEQGGLLWGMEMDTAAAAQELRALGKDDNAERINGFLSSVGLGGFADQLKDLQLGELLETLPPGVDELVAVSNVVRFIRAPEYSHFTRIIFDTAPTGHTLRLLGAPDFLDASLGKIIRLRQKLTDAADSVKGFFGGKKQAESQVAKLEAVQKRMEETRALFRDPEATQFVIVTIPTAMAAAESARLAKALLEQQVPVRMMVVNQVVAGAATEQFMNMRRRDQQRALGMLRSLPALRELQVTEAKLSDLEISGVAALQYFGGQVWQ